MKDEKELRRLKHLLRVKRLENEALQKRAEDAERAGRLLTEALERMIIRLALVYGEKVMDETRGKCIGRRLRLPDTDNAAELTRKWQCKALHNAEAGETVIGVGLRDDPDDHKTDAELAAEAEKSRG